HPRLSSAHGPDRRRAGGIERASLVPASRRASGSLAAAARAGLQRSRRLGVGPNARRIAELGVLPPESFAWRRTRFEAAELLRSRGRVLRGRPRALSDAAAGRGRRATSCFVARAGITRPATARTVAYQTSGLVLVHRQQRPLADRGGAAGVHVGRDR